MTKQLILALLGYCILLGSLVAQNNDSQPPISIRLSKMNVVYAGIDNPIEVSVEGLSAAEYRVQTDKGSLVSTGAGKYNLKVPTPGEVTLSVYTGKNQLKLKQMFRAKRIPDPAPALGAKFTRSDTISPGEFKAQGGITLLLEDFDFDVKCEMIAYKVTLISTYHDSGALYLRAVNNKGVRFSEDALDIIHDVLPGDVVIFSEIKGRCPGDLKDRDLNALVFFMEVTKED